MAGANVDVDRISTGVATNGLSVLGYTPAGANGMVAFGMYQHSSQLATAYSDDSGSNVWTRTLDIYDASSGYGAAIFYAPTVAAALTNMTFKVGAGGTGTLPSTGKHGQAVGEFSGLHPSAPYTTGESVSLVQVAPGGGADLISTGNLPVLATQPALIIGISFNATNTDPADTADASLQPCFGFGATNRGVMTFKRVTATTAVPLTWTNASNGGDRYINFCIALNETGVVLPGFGGLLAQDRNRLVR